MIDAVKLHLLVADPDRVASAFERRRHTESAGRSVAGPTITGRLGSLRGSLVADSLRLQGSLPAFVGSPSPLDRTGIARAHKQLEEKLGEDVSEAEVWKLEITSDLVLSRPVSSYLPLLLRAPHYQRYEHEGETVGFRLKQRELVFYDKAAERRARRKPAPDGNILRVELRFKKQLRRQLHTDRSVKLADLHAPDFYRRLVRRWHREYSKVEKARSPLPLNAFTDIRRTLAFSGLDIVGEKAAHAAVRAAMEAGTVSRSTGYSRIQWLRDLAADPDLTCEDSRIAELDAAVEAAAQRALSAA